MMHSKKTDSDVSTLLPVSIKSMRRLSRRQRLLLLLATCLSLVLVVNVPRRHLTSLPLPLPSPRPPQPPTGLPKLGEQSALFFAKGLVDGDFESDHVDDASPALALHLRSLPKQEADTPVPRSWEWLENDQEAPRQALLTPGYLLDGQRSGIGVPKLDAASVAKHVRVLWIGELSEAPDLILAYVERGFNVTVHTSVDRILDGFVPHVRRAYERAIPRVAGFDFLKLLLLYKHGGLVVDADTTPSADPDSIELPAGCNVLLCKETHLRPDQFTAPIYRNSGGPTYLFNRPYQLLNWAMMATEPRNRHIEEFINAAMRHFLGMRDMQWQLVQDVAGSGMLSDYVALLHEQHGLDYATTFETRGLVRPVEGLCMLEDELRERWIKHAHMATWYRDG